MQSFRMSGMGASFTPARACPVMNGPHVGPEPEDGGLLMADAATRDGSAAVRLVTWRCQYCGTLLAGVGRTDIPVGDGAPGTGAAAQEFTWLEENTTPPVSAAAGATAEKASA